MEQGTHTCVGGQVNVPLNLNVTRCQVGIQGGSHGNSFLCRGEGSCTCDLNEKGSTSAFVSPDEFEHNLEAG